MNTNSATPRPCAVPPPDSFHSSVRSVSALELL